MTSKGMRLFIWGFALLWVAVMIVFSFADLSLSKAIYNEEHSLFGQFFENFGEHPAFIVLFIAGSILFSTARHEKTDKKIFIRFVSGLFVILGGFASTSIALSRGFELSGGGVMLICLLAIIVVAAIIQRLLNLVPAHTLKMYNRAAWAGIVIIFVEIMLVNVLKIFWGRMRFRNMDGDYSQFTSWFMPQGVQENGVKSEVYKSFPSGHSANGWTMMVWMLFMPFANKWRNIMLSIAIVWGGCTSFSRIIMGDHFATDVLFGAFITIFSMLFICKLFKVDLYPASFLQQRSGISPNAVFRA
ncbi:hypothetical protein BK120_16745 [Paenibacillus sp. FSL A5-0031]|uniref:phosphatase PAP2 family protein n=1 Tax=Paenibacillus sp. FSL A5-0031 TaxID=1920420 RepID=UPI00096D632F|nr:phosphatase PAP2 family protein [Paenibacillus sp. FSL A5-0031]OME82297.1 hypothetical protein BK120_16745 [Paenibacillus sp. FSL A5-0031]